jgi:hypothetical protein
MKAEDVARLWDESPVQTSEVQSLWADMSRAERSRVRAFASLVASEERAAVAKLAKEKAHARQANAAGELDIDWSAFDAAVKESGSPKHQEPDSANPMCTRPECGRRKFEHYSIGNMEGLFCRKYAGYRFTTEAVDAAVKEQEGNGG